MERTGLNLLSNDIALVTGAASSIGRAIAFSIAREGAHVIVTDLHGDRNREVADEINRQGGRADAYQSDLSNRDAWKGLLENLGDVRPTLFVHSACPPRVESDTVFGVDEETYDAMLTTNVRSGFLLGRALAGKMKAGGVKGRMLYLTSLHAGTPRNLPHYSASKAAMTMTVQELARELGPSGIRVNAIAPGAVPGGGANIPETFMQMIPLRRTGKPDDIAQMAIALLSDRFSGYVTGTTVVVDGGISLFNWVPFTQS